MSRNLSRFWVMAFSVVFFAGGSTSSWAEAWFICAYPGKPYGCHNQYEIADYKRYGNCNKGFTSKEKCIDYKKKNYK